MNPLHASEDKPEREPGQQTGPATADDFDVILLGPMEERPGSRLGDNRVRMVLPARQPFHRLREGTLEATESAEIPQGRIQQATYWLKRALIGVPIATARADQERLTKFKALAVLSSDAISSVAFATEAILINLVAAGSAALVWTLPISLVILALLVIVTLSYRQTIPAYPNGGGSYIVARENLGTIPGLVAAAALMIDYVLNVAVCVAAGVHNVVSLFPSLQPYVILMDLALVVVMTVLNLRGVRESGTIFALPTYFFIVSALLLIGVGLTKAYVFNHQPLIGHFVPTVQAIEPLTIFVLLRSFATGCSAMTGVEAISNGIPIFRKPETRNASITLTWMACILGTLFLGITLLTMTYAVQAEPSGNPTVIAKIASDVFTGPLVFLFPIFQLSVLGILTLSAETSYADFPRLASLLARDKFLPSMFSFRGDRLAFSSGIIALAALSALLLVVFKGDTNSLINLFAVGVFIAFTLSQSGMVIHWWRLRASQKGWLRSMIINGTGALTTAIVALVVATMKFLEGAWIVVILIPVMVWLFQSISHHYHLVEQERTFDLPLRPQDIHHRVIVPIDRLDRATIQSLAYARSIANHVTAVHVDTDEEHTNQLRADWERWQKHIPEEEGIHLLIIASPFRSLVRPLLAYIDVMHQRHPEDILTVILPEFVVSHWWESLLHNQTALRLKSSLLFRPGIAVLNLPQHLRHNMPSGAAHSERP
ncbi:APC family permease [Dictyobacter kobayashii]|uniref:Amino acid permease n=1 Tax=Dictyobacter kobayashii TaxID=2014872 RepID=A0A402AQN9_9CHLR|nr:APC family permease [Dictyobacter kobayashii]GCE21385.1 amino acid permease [Dictyobacter kobayashii]